MADDLLLLCCTFTPSADHASSTFLLYPIPAFAILPSSALPLYIPRTQKTRAPIAIKAVSRQKLTTKLLENLESEINILKVISHRNVVSLEDCFVSATPHRLYIRASLADTCPSEKRYTHLPCHGVLFWFGSIDIHQEPRQTTDA